MSFHGPNRLAVTGLLAGSILFAGCGASASTGASSVASTSPSGSSVAPDLAAASAGAASPPAGLSLEVTDPKEGATIPAGNVTVSYDVSGLSLGPDYEAGVLLDVDATPYLQQFKPLPSGDDHVVLTTNKTVTLKNVAAGSHTVTVILTTSNQLSLSPPKFYKVSFQAQ